ncbi:MAG: hypothetical protein AB8B63_11855 [Granulosicoccus sp.]
MILKQLQGKLESQYDLDIPYDVTRFVSYDTEIARTLSEGACNGNGYEQDMDIEVVFVRQYNDTLEFTLYLNEALVESMDQFQNQAMDKQNHKVEASAPSVDDVCAVVEGVSHAVCLLWHAHNDRQIRPVDLELQAEVDKFMLLLNQQQTQPKQLHRQLFSECRLTPASDSPVFDRYKTANNLAARYCAWLSDNFIEADDTAGMDRELARFYRRSGYAKFEYINDLH